MKRIRKIVSFVLTLAMVMAMSITAMANEVGVTITLPEDELLEGHQFTAYQIFTGTQTDAATATESDAGNKLASVEWASEINASEFLTNLKKLEGSPFGSCETAEDVAKVLEELGQKNNTAVLEKVAQLAYTSKTGEGTKLKAGANNMPAGYYVIVDTTEDIGTDGVRNAALLAATKNVTVRVKTDKPTLEKKIIENATPSDYSNGAIGDVVNFQLKSTVPDMSHYEDYKFVVNDVMTKGLTFNGDVKVEINKADVTGNVEVATASDVDKLLASSSDAVKTEYAGGTAIKVVFKDFFESYKDQTGAEIVITYSATINKDAVIGVTGNPNMANLKYSNNPNEVGEGDDFNDDGTDPSGNTPWDETRTYVAAVELFKTGEDGKTALPGAQFKITGTKLNTTLVTGVEYVVAENGGYWQIKDANDNISYTDVSPDTQGLTQAAKNKYVDKTVQYTKNSIDRKETTKEVVNATAEVGADGILRIEGLAAGEDYEITEVMAPNGYNMLSHPIQVTIKCDYPENANDTECTWSGTYDLQDDKGAQKLTFKEDVGALSFTVKNLQGSLLPSTGGIGTTIFYVLGGILVIGAGVLLIVKKRMSKLQ